MLIIMDKTYKEIDTVMAPPPPHMVGDGFRVHNFFPSGYNIGIHRMSPFFLLDYNSKIDFSPRENPRGVGVHPHRGFETVTISYHGKVAHHDSFGNSGVISEGDVQWMTAGAGLLHKEYHEIGYSKQGGPFQMVQLWVNLPTKFKMTPPKYQSIENSTISKYQLPNGKGSVEIIAGEYKGLKGTASTFSPVNLFNVSLKKDAIMDFEFNEKHNTAILIVEGIVKVNESETVFADKFVLFRNKGEKILLEALDDSVILILSGEPLNEPIASYGPFVMNTKEEIEQAYIDLKDGKFGYLED
jgi:redox-sensitive bicupin YhaK (pirin superfamily)